MEIDNTLYIRCQKCACWHYHPATDVRDPTGFTDAMTVDDRVVMKCTDCGYVGWAITEDMPTGAARPTKCAGDFVNPTVDEILTLLSTHPTPSESFEYRARLQALWKYNDSIRYSFKASPSYSEALLRNCEWLASFGVRHFTESGFRKCEDFLQFEMLRYLGRFEEAIVGLEKLYVRQSQERDLSLLHFWYALCQAGDNRVRIFPGQLELYDMLPSGSLGLT